MKHERKFLWLIPAELSLLVNSAIVFSVSLNLDWVRTRAAGGGFTQFPLWLRALYLVMTLLALFLMKLLWRYASKDLTVGEIRTCKILALIFIMSTFLQLISRSADERWNAIPALIIAGAFYQLSRQSS